MPLVPLADIGQESVGWSTLKCGRLMTFQPGDRLPPGFHDAQTCYVVTEGHVRFLEDTRSWEARTGDALVVAPGTSHAIMDVYARSTILLLEGRPQPPFRSERLDTGADLPVALAGGFVGGSPRRRGLSVHFDETQTFSPAMLGTQSNGDLLLAINLGAIVKTQIDVIRQQMKHEHRVLIAAILRCDDFCEIEELPRHGDYTKMLGRLRPRHVGLDADILTSGGHRAFDLMMRHWKPLGAASGFDPCVRFAVDAWSPHQIREIFRVLADNPPAALRVCLTVDEIRHLRLPAVRQTLAAMIPWLVAVEYNNADMLQPLEELLEARGYQGWLVQSHGRTLKSPTP